MDKAIAVAKAKKIGDPFEDGVENGPQISQKQLDRIESYIEIGKKEDYQPLLDRMTKYGIDFKILNDDPTLFNFLV